MNSSLVQQHCHPTLVPCVTPWCLSHSACLDISTVAKSIKSDIAISNQISRRRFFLVSSTLPEISIATVIPVIVITKYFFILKETTMTKLVFCDLFVPNERDHIEVRDRDLVVVHRETF